MPPHAIQVLTSGGGNDGVALLDADGRAITSQRREGSRCTDCPWCILFLIAIAGLAAMGGFGFKYGNPDVWSHFVTSKDYSGRLCGIDDAVKDFPYAYYTLKKGSAAVGNSSSYWTNAARRELRVVCSTDCPKANAAAQHQPVADREGGAQVCAPGTDPDWCTWYGATTFKLVHYCIDPQVFDVSVPWEQWIEDLRSARWHLLAVFPVSIIMGFLFLGVLEHCGAVVVWAILVILAIIPAGLGLWVFHDAGVLSSGITGEVKSLSNLDPESQKYVAYVLWGISASVVLLSCCFAGTVKGIAAVVSCTSQFLKEVPSQMLQPFVFALMHLVVIASWLAIFLQVVSIGASEGDTKECLSVGDIYCVDWQATSKWAMLYMFLMVYWMLNFLHACSHFGTSFAVGAWYFSRADASGAKVPVEGGISCCDVMLTVRAVCHGLRHHSGSLAFGSFCISLAKVCKLILRWVSKDVENTSSNGAVRCCLCLTNCLADCFERFISFVSEHAYVEIALTGAGFCQSAKKAMHLAIDSPGLFTLVGRVAFVVKLMGVAIVTCISTYVVALTLWWWTPETMHSMTAPLVAAGLCSLTIGEVMMHPFTAAARANLHCYCLDKGHHHSPEFTPLAMQGFIDDHESHLDESKSSCCGRCCPCAL